MSVLTLSNRQQITNRHFAMSGYHYDEGYAQGGHNAYYQDDHGQGYYDYQGGDGYYDRSYVSLQFAHFSSGAAI